MDQINIISVLRESILVSADGKQVTVPTQLSTDTWAKLKQVLTEHLAGTWRGGKTQAFIFQESIHAALGGILTTGTLPPRNPLSFFGSSDAVIDQLLATDSIGERIRIATHEPNDDGRIFRIFEPHGGEGAIARRLRDLIGPYGELLVCEWDPRRAALLREQGFTVIEQDVLTYNDPVGFDWIVANPPFSAEGDRLAYVSHLEHCKRLLRPRGQLVSVTPDFRGSVQREDAESRLVKFAEAALCGAYGDWVSDLPKGSFSAAGTGVDTLVVLMGRGDEHNWKDAPHCGLASGWVWQFMMDLTNNYPKLCDQAERTFTHERQAGQSIKAAAAIALTRIWPALQREHLALCSYLPERAKQDCLAALTAHFMESMPNIIEPATPASVEPSPAVVSTPTPTTTRRRQSKLLRPAQAAQPIARQQLSLF